MTIGKPRIATLGNDLNSLYFKRSLGVTAVKTLDQLTDDELAAKDWTDEMRKSSMEHYKKQLAEIDRQITVITGTPPAITVGLETAVLFGKADKLK